VVYFKIFFILYIFEKTICNELINKYTIYNMQHTG